MAVLIAAPTALLASDLSVQGSKVMAGSSAATLTLSSTCTSANHIQVTGTVSGGTFEACSTITADADLSGSVTMEAGNSIALATGFSVASGAALTARLTPSLYADVVLTDTSPQAETVYAARLWINTDDYTPNGATRFDHLAAFDAGGGPEFRVVIKQSAESLAFIEVVDDAGGVVSTEDAALALASSGWHSLKVVWVRSTGADNGSADLCVDEVTCTSLAGLDNDTGVIDLIEWGARNLEGGSAGALHLDEFESFRNAGLQE